MNYKNVLILVIFLGISFINAASASVPWYDQNWQYRKAIDISNTGENLVNYQIGLTIDTQSLISAGKLKSDGSDMRFVDSNNNLLPFWNETAFNIPDTIIWVKVPSISNTISTTIYMYYGNPGAASRASGSETFDLFENNFFTPLDNSPTFLTIPTYEGSGQAVHPDVYYNPGGWHGYKYWMAMEPYPYSNDDFENPSIIASNDGISWEVPAGLTNPIAGPPQYLEYQHYNDADLLYNETVSRLETYYDLGDKTPPPPSEIMKRKTSTNGTSWSAEEDILYSSGYELTSPAIVRNQYNMWVVDIRPQNNCEPTTTNIEYRNSSNGINWSDPVTVNISPKGNVIWHIDVSYIPSKNEYWMLYAAFPAGSYCGNTELYFAKSTDKINWITYDNKVLGKTTGPQWDSEEIYRSTLLYDNTTDMFRVWYSAKGYGTGQNGPSFNTWHIGYTERYYPYFADALRWTRTGDTESSTANPQDGAYGLMHTGGSTPPEHELSQLSGSSGSYSYNIWYKDEMSTVSAYRAALTLTHGATFSSIGVFAGAPTNNYVRAVSGSYADTGIVRTAGCHRLEIRVNNTGMYFFIDGINAGSTSSVTSATSITPGINGDSSGTAYYMTFGYFNFTTNINWTITP